MRVFALVVVVVVLVGCPKETKPVVPDADDPKPTPFAAPDAGIAVDSGPTPVTATMRAEDWEIAKGEWTFANGEATCTCASGATMFWKGGKPKDFDASIDVRFSVVESSAGLVFREQAGTFYQFEWYTRGTHHDRRLSLMVKNPYWVQIVTPTVREPPLDKWITLRVRARGDRIETFVDGAPAFEKIDQTYVREGRIGVQIFQPRTIRLARFQVESL